MLLYIYFTFFRLDIIESVYINIFAFKVFGIDSNLYWIIEFESRATPNTGPSRLAFDFTLTGPWIWRDARVL